MKANYDFSKARRGAVLAHPGRKTRITIRLDRDLVEWFRAQAMAQGGGNYQTMINDALRQWVDTPPGSLESMLRKVVREEIRKVS